jgi:hypothetical protein
MKETRPQEPSRKLPQEQETPSLLPEAFVKHNRPAYIIELLTTNPSLHITPEQFDELVIKSRPTENSNSLIHSSRIIDNSGVVANLAGLGMTSDKVAAILTPICTESIEYINSLPSAVQEEVYFSYLPGRGVTPRALVVGNEVWTQILNKVKKYREQDSFAMHLRARTGHELEQLIEWIKHIRPFVHKKVINDKGSSNDSSIYLGTPVQYLPYYNNVDRSLSNLEQVVVGINFASVEIEDPKFLRSGKEAWTNVAEVIRSITPAIFRRSNESKFHFDPKEPLTLLLVAGKASQSLVQALTKYLTTKYNLDDLINHPTLATNATEEFLHKIQPSLSYFQDKSNFSEDFSSIKETQT